MASPESSLISSAAETVDCEAEANLGVNNFLASEDKVEIDFICTRVTDSLTRVQAMA